MSLESLQHTQKQLSNGGIVLVLNTGALIGPESEAMLQALHSRSIGGIRNHLEVLKNKGPEKFMSTFYVGYGHKSIGDCATATIFVEGVSMLVAKAIQDWPLYSGQEASTRYIDFKNQLFIDPKNTKDSKEILENWRSFYVKGLERLSKELPKRFPINEGEEEKTYNKAIMARAFDIMRSFLPSGATTNLAWHTNFRQAADHLMRLRHHPLDEVREVVNKIEEALEETFPSSFGHPKFETTEKYNKDWMQTEYYYENKNLKDFGLIRNGIDIKSLKKFQKFLKKRPIKTELPKEIKECGDLQFEFLLDFGSFRDIQRHRAITQRMPLVVETHGFEEWYLSELPKDLREEAKKLIREQKSKIAKLKLDNYQKQYYIPMGYKLPNKISGSLPSILYMCELRSTIFVHPTLRKRAIQIAKTLEQKFKKVDLVVHSDKGLDRFDIKRGEQDIVVK